MRARPLAVAALFVSIPAGPAVAQHVTGDPWPLDPEYTMCSLCHTVHGAVGAPRLLKTAEIPDAELQSPRLSAVSRSCLRCHWTPTLRDQQDEFLAPSDPVAAAYLGPDLSDDHPLRGEGGQMTASVLRPLLAPSASVTRSLSAEVLAPTASGAVGCVDCHEPHAPGGGIIPDPVEQLVLCTRCHDAYMPYPDQHASLACTDCHRMHGGTGKLLRDPATNPTCTECHATTPTFPTQSSPDPSVSHAPLRLRPFP